MALYGGAYSMLKERMGILVSTVLQGVGSLAALLFTSLLARHLDKAEFGHWIYSRNLIDMIAAFAVFSLPQYILFMGKKKSRQLAGLVVAWWLGTIIILSAMWLFSWVNTLMVFCLAGLFLNSLVRPLVLLQSRIDFGILATASWVLANIVAYLLAVHNSDQAVLAYGLGFFIPALYYIVRIYLADPASSEIGFELCKTKGFLGYNISVFLANLSQIFIIWYVTRHVLQSAGAEEVGLLGVALTICLTIGLLPVSYLAPIIQQRWSESRAAPRQHIYWKLLLLIAVIGVAAIPLLKFVISLLFGIEYLDAVEPSVILLLSLGLFYFERFQMLIGMSMGYVNPLNYAAVVRTSVVMASPFMVTKYDAPIAVFSLVIGYLMGAVVAAVLIGRRQDEDANKLGENS
jgi:O-antigen/teichoic acid export membrane protein